MCIDLTIAVCNRVTSASSEAYREVETPHLIHNHDREKFVKKFLSEVKRRREESVPVLICTLINS